MSNLVHWRPHIADARKFQETPYACGRLTGNYAEFPQFRDHVTCPVCLLIIKDETNSANAQPSAQTGVKGSVSPTTESVGGLADLIGSEKDPWEILTEYREMSRHSLGAREQMLADTWVLNALARVAAIP